MTMTSKASARSMLLLLLLCVAACAIQDASAQAAAAPVTIEDENGDGAFSLTLMHTSRVRGNIFPVNKYGGECTLEQTYEDGGAKCTGGAHRRRRFFDEVRASYRNVVTIDTGAYFWGSFFFSRFEGEASAQFFQEANYDVMGLSQEDFHSGPAVLGSFISTVREQGSTAGVVCSNIDVSDESTLQTRATAASTSSVSNSNGENTNANADADVDADASMVKAYHIVEVAGRKIAFVGAVSSNLAAASNPGEDVEVNEIFATVASAADTVRLAVHDMQEKHPEVKTIILVTSLDTKAEVVSVVQSIYEIDAVVWGPPSNEPIMENVNADDDDAEEEHPYPHSITNHLGEELPLIHAGNTGNRVGLLTLAINSAGVVTGWSGNSHKLKYDTVAPAPPANALLPSIVDIEEHRNVTAAQMTAISNATFETMLVMHAQVEEFKRRTVARLPADIYGERGDEVTEFGVRWSDTPMGRVIGDAMLEYCTKCTIAIINSGAVRASLDAADMIDGELITYGDMLQVLPFQNSAVSLKLKGKHLRAVMINAISEGGDSGRFPMVAGLRFAWNPAFGDRLTQLQVQQSLVDDDGNIIETAWVDVDDEIDYHVATQSFMLQGGDGFSMFLEHGTEINSEGPLLSNLLQQYFQKHYPIDESALSAETVTKSIYTSEELMGCNEAQLPLERSGDCLIVKTSLQSFQLRACPSQPKQCRKHIGNDANGVPLIGTNFFPGMYVNSTTCEECSGMGDCDSVTLECSCRAATNGVYDGIIMAAGSDCSILRTEVNTTPEDLQVIVGTVTGITLLVCLTCAFMLLYLADEPIIKASNHRYGLVTIFGGMLAVFSPLVSVIEVSAITCRLSTCFLYGGYTLAFATLFAKEYRIHCVFNSSLTGLKAAPFKNGLLVRLIVGVMAFITTLLVVSAIVSPYEITGESLIESQNEFSVVRVCTTNDVGFYFTVALTGSSAALLCWGLWLAYHTRKVQQEFSESKWISMSGYNVAFCVLVMFPVTAIIRQSNPTAAKLAEALTVNYCVIVTLCLLFVPKIYVVMKPPPEVDELKKVHRVELPMGRRASTAIEQQKKRKKSMMSRSGFGGTGLGLTSKTGGIIKEANEPVSLVSQVSAPSTPSSATNRLTSDNGLTSTMNGLTSMTSMSTVTRSGSQESKTKRFSGSKSDLADRLQSSGIITDDVAKMIASSASAASYETEE